MENILEAICGYLAENRKIVGRRRNHPSSDHMSGHIDHKTVELAGLKEIISKTLSACPASCLPSLPIPKLKKKKKTINTHTHYTYNNEQLFLNLTK